MIFPAIIGAAIVQYLNHLEVEEELATDMEDKLTLLAHSLTQPMWNFDINAIEQIVEAALLDPQMIRISVLDPESHPFISAEKPERRLGEPRIANQELVFNEELAGMVEIEMDAGLAYQRFREERNAFLMILSGQVALTLGLILFSIHSRVLSPLAKLTAFSNRLADGDFDQPPMIVRADEIGSLASRMDKMRHDLQALFLEQEAILSNVQVGLILIRKGRVELANRFAERIFGFATEAMEGIAAKDLYLSEQQFIAIYERAVEAMDSPKGFYEEEILLRRQDGGSFWADLRASALDPLDSQAGSIWVIEDISERKAAEDEIHSLAFFDPLTALPNRRLLLDRLQHALAASARNGHYGALVFLDLDHFKKLNDTHGHEKGDQFLQQVANRLSDCVGETDTVARLGGDEFVLLLEDLSADSTAAGTLARGVCEAVVAALYREYRLEGSSYYGSTSAGVTLFLGGEHNSDELLKRADMAMYEAKAAGRNTFRFFDRTMQDMLVLRAELENDLRRAIDTEQLVLYYQPQVAGLDPVCCSVEALVRWHHPERGVVSPATFIPLAEESDLILLLGYQVIRMACQQLAIWSRRPETARLKISVNVSVRQLRHPCFVESVMEILQSTGTDPRKLKIEITESCLVENTQDVIAKLNQLRELGMGFSLDDFGTGYASLGYLKRLPLDELKIDQSFVKNILEDPNDAAIARMVLALAASLGLGVVAEGVELEAQRAYLAGLGCQVFQGYLFSPPLPIEDIESYLLATSPVFGSE